MSRTASPGSGKPYGLARVCRVWRAARATVYRHRAPPRAGAAAASRAGRADAGRGAGGGDPGRARRQPLPRRGPPQGLGPAAPRRRAHLEAPGAAADARARPARPLAGRLAARPAQPRRHHHPRHGGHDVGHRPDHHLDRRGPGRGVRRRRPLLGRVRRHPRRPPRHPLRGAGADPPGRAPPLRRRSRRTSPAASPSATTTAASTWPTTSRRNSRFLGIESSPAFVRAPEGNGCAERFIRTLKENLLVGADLRHRRGAAPGAARVPRDLQHDLADRAARLQAARRHPARAASTRGPGRVGFNPVSSNRGRYSSSASSASRPTPASPRGAGVIDSGAECGAVPVRHRLPPVASRHGAGAPSSSLPLMRRIAAESAMWATAWWRQRDRRRQPQSASGSGLHPRLTR